MAVVSVHNNSPQGLLALWLEPPGEDRWLRPGETFCVRSDYEGTEPDFMVEPFVLEDDRSVGTENVTVWILESNCWGVVVVDLKGNVIECGHGRPVRVDERWRPDL